MRVANLAGRAALVVADGRAVDIEEASEGRFGPAVLDVYDRWDEFRPWAATIRSDGSPFTLDCLGPPVPCPRQVFAIGLNYADHAAEAGAEAPTFPPTFTKFPTCLVGPSATVELSSDTVDWEVELVAVIGRAARRVEHPRAWSFVAGLTIGQDLSDRVVQMRPPMPQFALGKSFPGYGPTGPWVVTPDEIDNPDDLALSCAVNGITMQDSRSSQLIFSVPALVSALSSVTALLPGDLIFTGTPAGVGVARDPKRFLQPGDELVSRIEGIGSIHTRFTPAGGTGE